jgi:hypothetical protein
MPNVQKMIEDFIKGARMGSGFMRGGQVGVEQQIIGQESKLATSHAGLGAMERLRNKMSAAKEAGLGGGVGATAAGPVGAALGAGFQDQSGGSALGGGLGSLVGGGLGGLAGHYGGKGIGALIAQLADTDPEAAQQLGAALGAPVGAIGGSILGGHFGQNIGRPSEKQSALHSTFLEGFKAACDRFKIGAGLMGAALAMGKSQLPNLLAGGAQAAGSHIINRALEPKQPRVPG